MGVDCLLGCDTMEGPDDEAASISETSVFGKLHGITSQKIVIFIFAAMRI
jgi:hypothetical protein